MALKTSIYQKVMQYWKKTNKFWKEVRSAWQEVEKDYKAFKVVPKKDGQVNVYANVRAGR